MLLKTTAKKKKLFADVLIYSLGIAGFTDNIQARAWADLEK